MTTTGKVDVDVVKYRNKKTKSKARVMLDPDRKKGEATA